VKRRALVLMLLYLVCTRTGFAQTKIPPETSNAALRYWLAFAELKDPPAELGIQELLEKTLRGQIPWEEEKLGRILDMNRESLGIFERATKLPDCEWGLEYGQSSSGSIAYVPRARVLARLNTLRGIREMAKGNSQGAVDAWLEGIHFSDQLTHGGSLIFGLMAKETMIPNLQWLTTATRKGQLTEKAKRQVEAALKALPEDGVEWGAIWGMESALLEVFLEKLRTSPKAVAEYESVTGETAVKGCVPPTKEEVKSFREYMAQVQASLRLPPLESKMRLEGLEPQRKKLCVSEQNVIPNSQKTNEARLQLRAAKDELQQALRGN
jgi:hypothetical protein